MQINHQDLLSMISKTYDVYFNEKQPYRPDLGRCRVQGVAISELNEPEILLLQEGEEHPDFYLLTDISLNQVH